MYKYARIIVIEACIYCSISFIFVKKRATENEKYYGQTMNALVTIQLLRFIYQ